MYNELVFHLDLCMLSYHLHAQTFIWPLDPYMEQVATSTTQRRENFMTNTHAHFVPGDGVPVPPYHGPGACQGWPTNKLLDPLMTRYDQLFPWRPVFVGPERKNWLWHNTPKEIINPIRQVYMQTYWVGNNPIKPTDDAPELPAATLVATRPGTIADEGTDLLYCFEGGTGTIEGSPASWSLMGFCLARNNNDGDDDDPDSGSYDVHIAFRGSRSGSGGRAMSGGLQSGSRSFAVRTRDESGERHMHVPGMVKHAARGNGDWVTDMDMSATKKDPMFSAHGAVCRGFSSAQKTCIPLVIKCMEAIQAKRGKPPAKIWVTGHSLGAALAGEFVAAMICGTVYGPMGSKLPDDLVPWPWDTLRFISMSSPIVGGDDYHTTFNSRVYTRRVVLGRDPITQGLRHYHVGQQVHLEATDHTPGGAAGFGHHEPFHVRRSLLDHLGHWQDKTDNVPQFHSRLSNQEPWAAYKTFHTMINDQRFAAQIPDMLSHFPAEFARYLEILKPTLKEKSTHKAGHNSVLKPWKPRVSETEKTLYDTALDKGVALLQQTQVGTYQEWITCLDGVGGEHFGMFLKLAMLISATVLRVQKAGAPIDLYKALDELNLKDI